jgi:hypothetical protein
MTLRSLVVGAEFGGKFVDFEGGCEGSPFENTSFYSDAKHAKAGVDE